MFTVISKPACSYCDQAKSALKFMKKDFNVLNVDVGQDKLVDEKYISREELLSKYPSMKSFPLVLKEDQVIGGYQELKKYLMSM